MGGRRMGVPALLLDRGGERESELRVPDREAQTERWKVSVELSCWTPVELYSPRKPGHRVEIFALDPIQYMNGHHWTSA